MKKILLLMICLLLAACEETSIKGKYNLIACDYRGFDCSRKVSADLVIEDDLDCLLNLNYSDGSKVMAEGKIIEADGDNYIFELTKIDKESHETKLALGHDSKNNYLYLRMDEGVYYIFGK